MKNKTLRLRTLFVLAVFTVCILFASMAVFFACKNDDNVPYELHLDKLPPRETWEERLEREASGSETFGDFLYQKIKYVPPLPEDAGCLEITRYTGTGGTVTIPREINGMPVVRIGQYAFRETKLTGVLIIPDLVYFISPHAFSGNELTEVIFPDGIEAILGAAFEKNRLASVTLPESVKEIHGYAFRENQLTSITIGANVHCFDIYRSFGDSFEEAYDAGGRQAGTYTRPDTNSTVWTKQ